MLLRVYTHKVLFQSFLRYIFQFSPHVCNENSKMNRYSYTKAQFKEVILQTSFGLVQDAIYRFLIKASAIVSKGSFP